MWTRQSKTKNFLAFFSRLLPSPLRREAEKEMERKFLVLLRRFSLRKEHYYFNIFVCSFLHPHGDRGASSPRSVVALNPCGFYDGSTNSSKWSLAIQNSLRNGETQNLYVFAPPSRAHTIIPAVLGKIIKRRGWLPYFMTSRNSLNFVVVCSSNSAGIIISVASKSVLDLSLTNFAKFVPILTKSSAFRVNLS